MLELQKIFLLVRFFNWISCNKGLKAKISHSFTCFFLFNSPWDWNVLGAERPLSFFILEIFKFKYDKVFVRHSASISKFEWFEQPCQNRKIHNSVKTYAIVVKYKLSECWWSVFVISAKKKFFFTTLGVAHNDPFSVQIGSKKTIFKRFYQPFSFQNCWIATQVININCIPLHIPLEISQK